MSIHIISHTVTIVKLLDNSTIKGYNLLNNNMKQYLI